MRSGWRERKVRKCPLPLLLDIDLSLLETLDQVVRCEIDQLDGIGAIEHGIWHSSRMRTCVI